MHCSVHHQARRLICRQPLNFTAAAQYSKISTSSTSTHQSHTSSQTLANSKCLSYLRLLQRLHPSHLGSQQHRGFKVAAIRERELVTSENIVRSPAEDIDIPTNVTLHEYIFSRCDEFKDLPALEDFIGGRKYTFGQWKEAAVKVASALYKQGFRKGDVILTSSPNCADYSVMMLACSAVGIWFCPANPAFTADELSRQISHCGAIGVCGFAGMTGILDEALANYEFPHNVKHKFVIGEAAGYQSLNKLMEDDGKSFPDVDINPQKDIFCLPYSSGTTGLPKGVMLTHYNCFANCLQVKQTIPLEVGDRCLGLLPLYHIYGMMVVQYSALQCGANLTFLPKFEPEPFLKCLQDKKITIAHLVPPLVLFLTKHPMVAKYDLTALRKVVSGAAPLGADITNEFLDRHKIAINQGYGLTETSPVTNIDSTATPGSVGHLLPNTLGKIVDPETNQVLAMGELGEYCVKGPQIMKGYLNNKQATEQMIEPDGWLHTGDIGFFNEEGMFFIKDRLKELIKYKGSQVPPAELEALLLGHPDISDVAVIGVPDEIAGELPRAFIVKKPGTSITEDQVAKFVEERVSPTKRLRGGVQFVEEIPKNPSGKILRRVIKDKYL